MKKLAFLDSGKYLKKKIYNICNFIFIEEIN